jgi:hypothetical protein
VKYHRPFGIETFDRTDGGITRTARPFGPASALGAGRLDYSTFVIVGTVGLLIPLTVRILPGALADLRLSC